MSESIPHPRIYDGDGDALMHEDQRDLPDRIMLVPDAYPAKAPVSSRAIRIMWGQHLLEDLLAGRYRTLVCAVNAEDNRGIISQVGTLLPTSQWDERSITAYAKQFGGDGKVKVLKYDMDLVEILAILRPSGRHLSVADLGTAFKIVCEMIHHKPGRIPTASVSFLGARANLLQDAQGSEPTFETVLHAMYEAGYGGDVYPSPAMWRLPRVGLYARYPFPPELDRLREGGS